mmetsp:Transcript_49699/g.146568  ORF Transcript_49699/g.146568 Transcript_49699/m.146568 type:complete len:411 (-) Transcript_49699:297-1529(-)
MPRQRLDHGRSKAVAHRRRVARNVELLETGVERERAEERGQVGVAELAAVEVDALARPEGRQQHAASVRQAERMVSSADGGPEEEGGLEAELVDRDAVEGAQVGEVEAVGQRRLALHVEPPQVGQPANERRVVKGGVLDAHRERVGVQVDGHLAAERRARARGGALGREAHDAQQLVPKVLDLERTQQDAVARRAGAQRPRRRRLERRLARWRLVHVALGRGGGVGVEEEVEVSERGLLHAHDERLLQVALETGERAASVALSLHRTQRDGLEARGAERAGLEGRSLLRRLERLLQVAEPEERHRPVAHELGQVVLVDLIDERRLHPTDHHDAARATLARQVRRQRLGCWLGGRRDDARAQRDGLVEIAQGRRKVALRGEGLTVVSERPADGHTRAAMAREPPKWGSRAP